MSDDHPDEDSTVTTLDSPDSEGGAANNGDENWEKRAKDAREYSRQLAEELKASREEIKSSSEKIARLEGRLDEVANTRTPEEPVEDIFEFSDEELDEIRNDPVLLRDWMRDKVWQTFANAYVAQSQTFNAKIDQLRSDMKGMDPETVIWKEKVDELRASKPAFADLSEEAAIEILKSKGEEPAHFGPAPQPRAGGRTLREQDLKPSDDEKEAIIQSFLPLCGGNRERAEKRAEKFIQLKIEQAKGAA